MDWIKESKKIFNLDKPAHFTNYKHCEECAEHDETLLSANIDCIGLSELGNPGWDPICFCTPIGKKYYMPSFIRLSLETINKEFYLGQFLFHLEADGKENKLYLSCTQEQRSFVYEFISFIFNEYTKQLKSNHYVDEALRVSEIWSKV